MKKQIISILFLATLFCSVFGVPVRPARKMRDSSVAGVKNKAPKKRSRKTKKTKRVKDKKSKQPAYYWDSIELRCKFLLDLNKKFKDQSNGNILPEEALDLLKGIKCQFDDRVCFIKKAQDQIDGIAFKFFEDIKKQIKKYVDDVYPTLPSEEKSGFLYCMVVFILENTKLKTSHIRELYPSLEKVIDLFLRENTLFIFQDDSINLFEKAIILLWSDNRIKYKFSKEQHVIFYQASTFLSRLSFYEILIKPEKKRQIGRKDFA